jgi:hypothetical protein
LQEYALIAEVVSALAIVLSLIFVGLQVRQGAKETRENSVALRSQVQQAMMEADKDLLLFRAENGNLDERGNFYYFAAIFRGRQLYWTQRNVGLLDDATYLSYMSPFVQGTLNDPDFTSTARFSMRSRAACSSSKQRARSRPPHSRDLVAGRCSSARNPRSLLSVPQIRLDYY